VLRHFEVLQIALAQTPAAISNLWKLPETNRKYHKHEIVFNWSANSMDEAENNKAEQNTKLKLDNSRATIENLYSLQKYLEKI
jgi:hypothetical protein